MRRREFITLVGGAAWLRAARAQSTDRMRRIGVLLLDNTEAELLRTGLRAGLGESGFVEEQNIRFEVRSADGKLDRLPNLAAELVGIKVDVIVALFTPSALAAKQATGEIPIVFLTGDPVGTGIVSSLRRPSGNLTAGVCLDLLHQSHTTQPTDCLCEKLVSRTNLAGTQTH
jgi:putative ABC transport system substrate-binding protein